MTFVQKVVLGVFVVGFLFLLVGGVVLTGLFSKKILLSTQDKKRQAEFTADFLETSKSIRNRVVDVEGDGADIQSASGEWDLDFLVLRGLPWVIYSRGSRAIYTSKTRKYSRIRFQSQSDVRALICEKRFRIRQDYDNFAKTEYGLRETLESDQLVGYFNDSNEAAKVESTMKGLGTLFSSNPGSDPLIVLVQPDEVILFLPFWPSSEEQFEFVADVLRPSSSFFDRSSLVAR